MYRRIDVCIATFKRPALLERLLRDLQGQQLPADVSMHIIVVDNDVLESARPVALAFQAASVSLDYLTEPKRNIALARNRALEHSQGDLIAFIDDDESAPPDWLLVLLAAMERHAADAVLGPVLGLLPAGAPRWIHKGRFFEPPPLPTGTRVEFEGGTGNALVKASTVRGRVAFDPQYGLSGSEDTDFFHRLCRTGAILVWCQEARLTEHVPEERLRVNWLLRRGFRSGQRFADIMGRPRGGWRSSQWAATRLVVLVAAGFLTMSCLPFSRSLAMRYALKGATSLGQVSTLFNYRYQEYRNRTP